jgi:ligand-binding sensor domain-containing protein
MAGSWIACNSSLALNRDIPTKDLHHIGWTVREGAPAGGVNSIAQSRDGYLWLASYSGLFRFDGLRFDRISFQHDDRLRSMTVYDVFAPTSGGLWMGFALGGVGFLDEKGSLTVYNYRDGLPSAPEHRLTEGPDGTIWIGTSAGIGRFVRGHWQPLQLEGLPEGSTSDSLLVDSDDTLWLATDQAIYYLPHGETKLHGPTSGFAGYVTLAESATGALWASDDRGLRFIHQSKRPSGKPRNAEYSMQFDRDGALWATQSGVVYRLSYPERMTDRVVAWTSIGDVFTRQNGLTSVNSYGSMLQDREGNFWLSTGEGLDRLSERNLADVPLPASLTGAGSQLGDLGVASAENGAVWIFAYDSMAHRDVDGRFETSNFIKNVSSVSRAQDGSLWAGTSNALWRFMDQVAELFNEGGTLRVPTALIQPIVSDELVAALADLILEPATHATLEVAGPETVRFDELIRRVLQAKRDARHVIADAHARYFGAELADTSLIPLHTPYRTGGTTPDEWLARTRHSA